MSRPLRARGLKRGNIVEIERGQVSRPLRARGLKLKKQNQRVMENKVAPPAGAWIETYSLLIDSLWTSSRPLRARGLKLIIPEAFFQIVCRAPCGRVD